MITLSSTTHCSEHSICIESTIHIPFIVTFIYIEYAVNQCAERLAPSSEAQSYLLAHLEGIKSQRPQGEVVSPCKFGKFASIVDVLRVVGAEHVSIGDSVESP